MTEHILKTWPEYYQEVVEGRKLFEYRLNDRDYQKDDVLHLKEYVPPGFDDDVPFEGYYTGRCLRKRVTYVLEIGKLGPASGVRFADVSARSLSGNLHQHVVMGLGDLYVDADLEPQPWVPMSDPQDIKVIGKLLEEAGEAVTAAARCLIQGINGTEPSSGRPNHTWLQNELSDVGTQLQITAERFALDQEAMVTRSRTKYAFLMKWLGMMGSG